MRERGDKTRDTNLLFSPALPVDCCVCDALSPSRKVMTLTKSVPVPWLLSGYRDFAKNGTGSAFTKQGADLLSNP